MYYHYNVKLNHGLQRHSGDREAEAQANPYHGAQRSSLPSGLFGQKRRWMPD
jgi:hypothetical protein